MSLQVISFSGVVQIISIITSLTTIILNLELGNKVGFELRTCSMIAVMIKIMPFFLTSTIFRVGSLVMMILFLRVYAIVPIFIMAMAQNFITRKGRLYLRGRQAEPWLAFLPFEMLAICCGSVLVVPTRLPWNLRNQFMTQIKSDQDRKWYFLLEAISTFAVYGLTLITITVLWEKTTLLHKHLNTCTFEILKNNVIVICSCLSAVGLLHCILTQIYTYCM